MLENYEDAEDATQEIFMKAYQNIEKFRQESKFSTWLYRIALNHIYNFQNNSHRLNNQRNKEMGRQRLNIQGLSAQTRETPETVLEKNELYRKFSQIIDDLPQKQKEVFVLRHYNGLSFKDIAKILKRSLGGTKSNYFFAMQKIKKRLQKNNLLEFLARD